VAGRFEKDGMGGPLVLLDAAVGRVRHGGVHGDPVSGVEEQPVHRARMRVGRDPNTGHLERVVFNDKTEEIRRESPADELRQRIRDVRQGPDGLLYLLTDENPGALLKIEPAP
jgi:hypothetical protein